MGILSGVTRGRPDSDKALSEVIGLVMILGIIFIFIMIWSTYVVPNQGREAEIAHMNDVKNWFTDYKFSLDSLWINNMEYDRSGVLISSSLDLGTLTRSTEATGFFSPILQPMGSYGSIQIRNYSEQLKINAKNPARNPPETDVTIYPNSLEYSAENAYWIPQTYYYQMGGVFLNQTTGTVALITPEVSVYRVNDTIIGLRITPVIINASGVAGFSGSSNVRVDSRLKAPAGYGRDYGLDDTFTQVNLTFILRDVAAAKAWQTVLNETRFEQGVPSVNCGISRPENPGNRVFMNVSPLVRLKVYPANFSVSVQPIGSVLS